MSNNYPVIFVHGIMGFGPEELGPLRYWGTAFQVPSPLPRYEASLGPISSAHDRACELAAQIKGGGMKIGWGPQQGGDMLEKFEETDKALETVGVAGVVEAGLGQCGLAVFRRQKDQPGGRDRSFQMRMKLHPPGGGHRARTTLWFKAFRPSCR